MTYDEVAHHFGLTICPAPGHEDCLVATWAEHRNGTVTPRGTQVHWTPRRMTRSGLRRFLKAIARTRVLRFYRLNKPMRIYTENVWAYRAAAELHVRLPAHLSTSDRLLVRWLHTQGATISPAAQRWATRKETTHA